MKASMMLAVLFTAFTAAAQNYAINWFTIDGGGGEAGGGGYSLRGTIGQPDAGAMSGSGFSIAGGFWTEIAPPTALPSLRIARMGPNAIIAWPNPSTGFQLQEAAALPGMWSTVGQSPTIVGSEKQVTVPAMGSRFYRLQKP
jgi:hypothetical protein